MIKHQHRTLLICSLAALSIIGLIVAAWLQAPVAVLTAIGTAAGIFTPAAADALQVERRRVDPTTTALIDDVVQLVKDVSSSKTVSEAESDSAEKTE